MADPDRYGHRGSMSEDNDPVFKPVFKRAFRSRLRYWAWRLNRKYWAWQLIRKYRRQR